MMATLVALLGLVAGAEAGGCSFTFWGPSVTDHLGEIVQDSGCRSVDLSSLDNHVSVVPLGCSGLG